MTTEDILKGINQQLEDIQRWSRVQGLIALREILADFDVQEKIMYNAADGNTTTREIADEADVSTGTVSKRMNEWLAIGIIEKDGRQWKHVASLSEMGLNIPDIEDKVE